MIEYRRKNRKKLDATLRNTEDYINKHSNFKVSNIKIQDKLLENYDNYILLNYYYI